MFVKVDCMARGSILYSYGNGTENTRRAMWHNTFVYIAYIVWEPWIMAFCFADENMSLDRWSLWPAGALEEKSAECNKKTTENMIFFSQNFTLLLLLDNLNTTWHRLRCKEHRAQSISMCVQSFKVWLIALWGPAGKEEAVRLHVHAFIFK